MPRRSLLSRIRNAFTRERRPRPSPSRPSRVPPARERGREGDSFRDTWENEGGQGSYYRQREFFETLPGVVEESPREQEQLWQSYVRNIVNGESRFRRNDPRNPFWSDLGIHPNDFDWASWRENMAS